MMAWNCGRWVALGALLALSAPLCSTPAEAARHGSSRSGSHASAGHGAAVHSSVRAMQAGVSGYSRYGRYASVRYGRSGGIQCVPFARENSGIELSGNAGTWWNAAVGVYERGGRPEVGSVLNFRANGRMRMGHVAVVSRVISGRSVEIDHANWSGPGVGRGGISRNIAVVDVSPGNDWTAVRVALGDRNEYGSIYPTYGFIYDRPDRGTMVANAGVAPELALNTPPRDLRPRTERLIAAPDAEEEVAEAADDTQPRMRYASSRGKRSHVYATTGSRSGKGVHLASSRSTGSRNTGIHGASVRNVSTHGSGAKAAHTAHHGRRSF